MIKFFRHIRKNLLSEGKTGKYFKYAIGEIVLVVIGILIALSINNWNEKDKLKTEEIKFLKNFKQSLIADIEFNNFRFNKYDLTKESISILLNHMEQDLPYQDSLKYHFGRITQSWKPKINTEVFEALKSKDVNLISNDNLRDKLIGYYSWSNNVLDAQINTYVQRIEDASSSIFNSRFNALWNGNYQKYRVTENFDDLKLEMIPNNYNELKKDKVFMYFLGSLKNQFYWDIEVVQNEINPKINDLISSIDSELKTLE
ncbi:hypothetical protein H8K90_16040 [Winogradskyella echinorum]|uniref:Uncharacterized protein n=1 Tax=Winogradskyella echinorum TaxID=538189 RepID=A0ABR6Y5A8_9FLAO|nr:DUF6090 family protein [Winogradskyella echinorum]MBC3847907.1 hypothetical protein [Winogradskyella echinorum]MBC5752255.1 hypothetical protein [Winogradskyella echinorum]